MSSFMIQKNSPANPSIEDVFESFRLVVEADEIIKSTLIVLLVKLLVSPHTPLTAYFAVTIQGILGYFLFLPKIRGQEGTGWCIKVEFNIFMYPALAMGAS